MNKCCIIGNCTRDPQLRTVNAVNGPVSVCDFTVAVNRRQRGADGKSEADFFRVTAWRGAGETIAKHLTKGGKIYVEGPVSVRTYTGNDGVTRASLEITLEDFEFVGGGRQGGGAQQGDQQTSPQNAPPPPPPDMSASAEDDELPF